MLYVLIMLIVVNEISTKYTYIDGVDKTSRRVNIKFSSPTTTFRKFKCLDGVDVLRCMACKDGRRVGCRDRDGLVIHPHTYYERPPIDENHRHKCSHTGYPEKSPLEKSPPPE